MTIGGILNNNFNFCGADEVGNYFVNYCKNNDCDFTMLIQNATGKLFQMIGDINQMIATLQQSSKVQDAQGAYEQGLSLGTNLGNIARGIFGTL